MDLIKAAKEHLILYNPFFAYLALQINFVEDYGVDKSVIDGVTFRYNPDFIKSLDVRECAGLIAHAMSHVLLLHPLRSEHKEIKRWDAATDYTVNLIMKEANIPILNELYDPKYKGLEAEAVYAMLDDSENNNSAGNENSPHQSESGEQSNGNSDDESGNDSENSGSGEREEMRGSDICEVQYPDEPNVSEQEQKQRITQKIIDAAMQCEFCGTQLSEAITTIVNQLKEHKKDWREILFKFTAEIARNDYDWEKPDLIYLQRNIYIPSLHSVDIGGVIFAIDTSLSVNEELLATFLSELKEAAEQITKEITVIHCDTEVRNVEEVQSEEIDSIKPQGRGGTKFSPVFNYIEENNLDPKALIYFTDGICHENLTAPDYPVIWCIYDNDNFSPKFGEVIFIDK